MFRCFARIEMARGKSLELPKAPDAGIDRAVERAHRHLEGVARVDHERVGRCDQRVPIRRLDIGADLPGRVNGVSPRVTISFFSRNFSRANGMWRRPRI